MNAEQQVNSQPPQESLPSTKPTFKILCLDGGGFKGLSTAATLQVIEGHNGAIIDHFDMICGTSTGGLIALGLAAGKRAEDIVDFYSSYGPTIFPPLSALQKMGHFFRVATSYDKHKYSEGGLKSSVETILNGLQMQDAQCFLCIPSFNMTTFIPRVFKTDHAPSLTCDSLLQMSDVAMATSAAPTFFPIATHGKGHDAEHFVDGGLWANNPSMVGLTEALRFFAGPDKPYGGVALLSVGCAAGISGRMASPVYSRWGHNFASEMIEAAGEAQQQAVGFQLKFLHSQFQVPVSFERITIGPLSSAQAKSVALDTATPEATRTLLQLGKKTGHDKKTDPNITAFFQVPAAKIGLKHESLPLRRAY